MQTGTLMNPLAPLQRLHIRAVENAPMLVLAAMVLTGLGRLMYVNPAFAVACVLLIAVAMWRSGLPLAQQTSARRLAVAAIMLFVVLALAGPDADAGTIGGMATSLKNDLGSVYQLIIYGCYGGGLVSTGIGVNNGIKKSKGDQQVTTGSVLGYGAGGPALGMVGYVMDNAAGSMGGGASNMNQLPAATN